MKNIKIKHQDEVIVSAMNFHAYGDLWIQPLSYKKDKTDSKLKMNKATHFMFNAYEEFHSVSYKPKGAK